jgi:hypothetical protein
MKKLTFATFIWICLACFGCSKYVSCDGVVTFSDGTPLDTGKIIFVDEKFQYDSQLKKGGNFSIGGMKDGEGLPPGKYNVYFSGVNEYVYDELQPTVLDRKASRLLIDRKFESETTSGLNYEVKKDLQPLKIIVEKYSD